MTNIHLFVGFGASKNNTVDGSEIRLSPVEVGSLSHDFTGFYTSQVVVNGISEPSALGNQEATTRFHSSTSLLDVDGFLGGGFKQQNIFRPDTWGNHPI